MTQDGILIYKGKWNGPCGTLQLSIPRGHIWSPGLAASSEVKRSCAGETPLPSLRLQQQTMPDGQGDKVSVGAVAVGSHRGAQRPCPSAVSRASWESRGSGCTPSQRLHLEAV